MTQSNEQTGPLVSIAQGELIGKYDKDYLGGRYCSFHSIPYAKPPTGELRFKAPQPAEPWEGLRDATNELDECLSRHIILQHVVGSEDCLTLNVYTPDIPNNYNHLKPVMFWIHGGGFTTGSGKTEMYGPEFLITQDLVLVTINYRLGVFGFLSLDDPALGVPGNAGMKDMVMGLRWVRDNIKAFNGDPDNVTIFGESAGGAACHFLMLSPMAKGLFHKVIAQSGCSLNTWAYGSGSIISSEIATHLGCTTKDETEILKTLQTADAHTLLDVQYKIKDPFTVTEIRPFAVVIENINSHEEPFLCEAPIDIIASGNYNKVPLIMGYTSREGMLFSIMEKKSKIDHKIYDFEDAIPYTLKLTRGTSFSKDIAKKIKKFYYENSEPTADNIDKYYRLQTDNIFYRGIYSSIKNHIQTSDTPVYLYRFSLEADYNFYKKLGEINHPGVCHADELGYLFKNILTTETEAGNVELTAIKRLTSMWANFARSGNPNPDVRDQLIPIEWPTVKRDAINFINIGENLTVGVNPEADRMNFWDDIYAKRSFASKL